MIWQWKAQKGSPYAEDMGTYGDALAMRWGRQPGADHRRAAADIGQRHRCVSVAGADTMSQHQAFRRTAVPQQVAQQLQTITIAAPTRGIILSEN